MPAKLTVDIINKRINPFGYVCTNYSYSTRKFNYICPKGHNGSMRMDHWVRGVRCAKCAGNKKLSFDEVKSNIESEGYILLSTKYINSNYKLLVKCPRNHTYKVSYRNWNSGHRCPYCSSNRKKEYKEVVDVLGKNNYTLLTEYYTSNKQKLTCVCPNNHVYKVSLDNFLNKNSRCPKCRQIGTSYGELSLIKSIQKFCTYNIITNDRSLIYPKELDIIIPETRLAIEYCGLYWHSELAGKNRWYHFNKYKECKKINYILLTIFEDEWINKKSIVLNIIKNNLGLLPVILDYKNISIEFINIQESMNFYNSNYLFDVDLSETTNIGVYSNDHLILVLSFKLHNDNICNILYLAYKNKISSIVFEYLLKFISKFYGANKFVIRDDLRWSLYGFLNNVNNAVTTVVEPKSWYFRNNTKRYKVKYNNYNKLWDCGYIEYLISI